MAHPREAIRGVKLMEVGLAGRFSGVSLPQFEIGLGDKFVPCDIDGEPPSPPRSLILHLVDSRDSCWGHRSFLFFVCLARQCSHYEGVDHRLPLCLEERLTCRGVRSPVRPTFVFISCSLTVRILIFNSRCYRLGIVPAPPGQRSWLR